MSDLHIDRRS